MSSTLAVVLVTTLLFGGLMSVFTKVIGLKSEPVNLDYSFLHSDNNRVIKKN